MLFIFSNELTRKLESTKVIVLAPLLKASKPIIPDPAKRSNNVLPDIFFKISNRLFLTREVVGRYGAFLTVLIRRPLYLPAWICTD